MSLLRYNNVTFLQASLRSLSKDARIIWCLNVRFHRHLEGGLTNSSYAEGRPYSRSKSFTVTTQDFEVLFFIASCRRTVQITFIFIDFRVCDFAFAFKTQTHFIFRQISICVLNANETFVWLVNAFDASYIAHYRSNGYAPVTSHIIAHMDLTSGFGNISLEWN